MPVLSGKPEDDSRSPVGDLEGRLQLRADRLERHRLRQSKVEILGEAVVGKIALLEGSPTLEQEALAERVPGEPHQEPRETVVALEDGLWDPATTGPGQAIREKGEVTLRNHGVMPRRPYAVPPG